MFKSKTLTDEQIELIKSEKYTNAELASTLNTSSSVISYTCKKLKIKLPSGVNLPSKNVNHSFFKNLNPTSAYILGFIAADGCVRTSKVGHHSLKIGLSSKDIKHLENIRDYIAPGNKIHTYKTNYVNSKNEQTYCCELNVCSTEMYTDLVNLGITERKSLTLSWPQKIKGELVSHFVRGYFDGDGCATISLNRLVVNMVGTLEFLTSLSNFCPYKKTMLTLKRQGANFYVLSYDKKGSAKGFLEWIYDDSSESTRLERKYLKYVNNIHLNEYIKNIKDHKYLKN